MKKILLLQTLFLLLLVTYKVQGQPANYQIYRSDDGIMGNAIYFTDADVWKDNATERITSGPAKPTYGPARGLNFITNNKIRMSIDKQGKISAKGGIEAIDEPVKIARLHIDPNNSSDGYSNGGIFFGGNSYDAASTGIASNMNGGANGPKNGLNFWTQGKLSMVVDTNGKVGIGVDPNKEECESVRLSVNGYIRAKGLLRYPNKNKSWPDYVFDKNYKLINLTQLEDYISTNKHLPHIPSAEKMDSESADVDLYDVIEGLTKTIEEQALYIIDINKRLKQLEKINNND